MRRILMAALTLALCVAVAPLGAQQGTSAPRPGWLGVMFDTTSDQRGVGIREVAANSPAARAGLQTGDLVLRVDGRAATLEGLRSLRFSPGDTVRFTIRRASRDRQIQVVAEPRPLAHGTRVIEGSRIPAPTGARGPLRPTTVEVVRRPGTEERVIVIDGDTTRIPVVSDSVVRLIATRMDTVHRQMRVLLADSLPAQLRRLEAATPEMRIHLDTLRGRTYVVRPFEAGRHAVAGAEFADLNPDLSSYFGAERGALVLRVAPDSPAARAGLTAGDVVVRVGTTAVTGVTQMRDEVGRSGRSPVQLEVIRRGQRRQITLSP
jgi:S1-C subfamily serine protease